MVKTREEMTELGFDDPMDWVYEVRRRISEKYGHDIERYTAALLEKRRQDEAGNSCQLCPLAYCTPHADCGTIVTFFFGESVPKPRNPQSAELIFDFG